MDLKTMPKTINERKTEIKEIMDSNTFIAILEGNKVDKNGKVHVSKEYQGYPCLIIVLNKV
jgi:hypothetical protein